MISFEHMTQSVIKKIGIGNIVGIIAGIMGAFIGLAAAFAESTIGGIVLIFVLIGFFSIFWFVMFKPMFEENRLSRIGESAEATIISIAENGSSLKMGGAIPKAGVTIQLEVRPKDKQTYMTTLNMFVSMFEVAKYQSGSVVQVMLDPKDPQKVAITGVTSPLGAFNSTQNNAATPVITLAEVQELKKLQDELFATGQEAKAIVKTAREVGINIGGNNPLMEFTLEVHPALGESFITTTKGPVARSAMAKCQPGQEMNVKFDPVTKKTMIFHS